mmetsp:Transcript_22933/g.54241  ORF Transcript_22933/g.54241 Transcript_22933/m.54241 type:complete len:192 (+) Transcript_22933:3001-3576(+)
MFPGTRRPGTTPSSFREPWEATRARANDRPAAAAAFATTTLGEATTERKRTARACLSACEITTTREAGSPGKSRGRRETSRKATGKPGRGVRIREDADRVDRIGNRGSEATIDAGVFNGIFLKSVRCWRERCAFRRRERRSGPIFRLCARRESLQPDVFVPGDSKSHTDVLQPRWEHHVVTNFKSENSLLV